MNEQTTENEMLTALRDLCYQIVKSIDVLWIVGKLPFLKLKSWVQIRVDKDKTD